VQTGTISPTRKGPTLFFSAGEPSGDLHGANLIRALQEQCPEVRCEGFGGDRMAAAGCELTYPLCEHSVMGFAQVVAHIPHFFRLLGQATEHFRDRRPDAVVLIDYPGFNWWVARRAHDLGIPVFYFVAPQIWGWATWRVRKMQRWVDHVLCTLPFEKPWYEARGVRAHYIGHPYFDDLRGQRLDPGFLGRHQDRPGSLVGILPGSRRQELENNLATQIRAAQHIHRNRPDTRFLIACFKREHADMVVRTARSLLTCSGPESGNLEEGFRGGWDLPLDLCLGRTPEIIDLAHSCLTVSGSVSLELLFRTTPAVVLYRSARILIGVYYLMRRVPYITLVNLLADRLLFPEFVTHRCVAREAGDHVLKWLNDHAEHGRLRSELTSLRDRVAESGACSRAGGYILQTLGHERGTMQAA
jgi:lipid-A-disaccharide synthase